MGWLTRQNGRANGLVTAEFKRMGIGLKCISPLDAGTEALFVPSAIIFNGASGNVAAHAHGEMNTLNDADAIAFQLLMEMAKGTNSGWAPYFAVLPSMVVTPRGFGRSALKALRDPGAMVHTAYSRDHTTTTVIRITPSLKRAVRLACATTRSTKIDACIQAHTSAASWSWAHAIVDSRALTFKGAKHLVPVADLVNHRSHSNAWLRKAANGIFFLRHHVLSSYGLQTFSDRNCIPGEQLFEDYGDNPTQIYIKHHGFVPNEENPFDCTPISLPVLNYDGNKVANRRIDLLMAGGINVMPSNCVTGELDRVNHDLRYFLWVVGMDPSQLGACVVAIGAKQTTPACEYAFRPPLPHDPTIMVALLDAATAALATFSTTGRQDKTALANVFSDDVHLAVKFRLAQKHVLMRLASEIATMAELASLSSPHENTTLKTNNDSPSWAILPPLQTRIVVFNAWAQSRQWPVLHVKAAVLESHGGRAGVIATRALNRGQTYIEVPEADCLSIERARRELGDAVRALDDFHAIVLLLIKHIMVMIGAGKIINATNSHLGPYLAVLPGIDDIFRIIFGLDSVRETNADVDLSTSPLTWADTPQAAFALAQSHLQGSALVAAIPEYIASVQRSYDSMLRRVNKNAYRNLTRPIDVALSWPIFRWAVQTLDSRSIWWNGQRHLVPMLDLVNAVRAPPPKYANNSFHRQVQQRFHQVQWHIALQQ